MLKSPSLAATIAVVFVLAAVLAPSGALEDGGGAAGGAGGGISGGSTGGGGAGISGIFGLDMHIVTGFQGWFRSDACAAL